MYITTFSRFLTIIKALGGRERSKGVDFAKIAKIFNKLII